MLVAIASRSRISELFSSQITLDSCEYLDDTDIHNIVPTLKNTRHYDYIIIDVSQLKNSDEEILSEIFALKVATSTPVIIIAAGKLRGDSFLARLVEMKLYNFVCALDSALAQKQVTECLKGRTAEQVAQYLAVTKAVPEKKSWFSTLMPKRKGEITTIGIAGVCGRIGTTTQALRLTRYLTESNQHTCYVEANPSGHVSLLGQVYSEAGQDSAGLIRYDGISMLTTFSPELLCAYGIRVFDCGTDYVGELFSSCSIQVIIAGSTPWEMAALTVVASPQQENRFYIFSLTGEAERQDILSFMGERFKSTLFAEYSPDMFSPLSQREREMYGRLLQRTL